MANILTLLLVLSVSFCKVVVVPAMSISTATTTTKAAVVIDSHLHVWANAEEASSSFPYAEGGDPPESLQDRASIQQLVEQMDKTGVSGALIVQPINHKFDHSYVRHAMASHPNKFKGMLLHDPSLSIEKAVDRLEELAHQGFVGVRFNPYLWPPPQTSSSSDNSNNNNNNNECLYSPMSQKGGSGMAVYQRCGELGLPVGIMCFQGLQLHYDDILLLLQQSPSTTMILDHFAFAAVVGAAEDDTNSEAKEEADAVFAKLLELAKYPQVHVKTSAIFRLGEKESSDNNFDRVRRERFLPLLEAFGSERLMFGSDFPFCLEELSGGYEMAQRTVSSWIENENDRRAIMGGTAQKVFGRWGS